MSESFVSINPSNEEKLAEYPCSTFEEVEPFLHHVCKAEKSWRALPVTERIPYLEALATELERSCDFYGETITKEMGKPIYEAVAEVKKCALLCRYYAEHGERFLADELVDSNFSKSFITFSPLGIILGIMPWNFPFWQVFRFAIPALLAGNAVLIKHAPNVMGTAYAIETLFQKVGFPKELFRVVALPEEEIKKLIHHPMVSALSLTGSERAGRAVAAECGKALKKNLLELGGSDPFIVLEDANIKKAVEVALKARLMNCGQSCIAAKRFFIEKAVFDPFVELLVEAVGKITMGDPLSENTNLGPLFALKEVATAEEAVAWANDSHYGLGASLWTEDLEKGEAIARKIEAGTIFINKMTQSSPYLPFGGALLHNLNH